MKHGKKYIEAAKNIERGRFVEQLYCHTELVRKFVSWYSLRMLRLKKLKQLVLIT